MFRLTRCLVLLLCALALLGMPAPSPAQTPAGPDENPRLAPDPTTPGHYTFSWWGRTGRNYVLQQSDDLNVWNELPVVEPGANQPIQWGFTSSAPKFFLRLRYLNSADDTNLNGIPDAWEMQYFGNLSHTDPGEDYDGEGLSNAQEYWQNSDPTDYYNGLAPTVALASGDNQYGSPGQVLAQPLVAQITRGGGGPPAANAPATFQVAAGQGQIAPTSTGPWTGTLTKRADAAGRVAIYLRMPATGGAIAVVSMGAGSAPPLKFHGLQVGVSAGSSHSVAVRNDGTVWAWGDNSSGKLGDGTYTNRPTPVQVSGLSGVGAICAGYDHTLALKSDGTVWAWGGNGYGQFGDGTTQDRNVPVQVGGGLTGVVAIAAGWTSNLALKSDGTVWAWGYNGNGQYGNGTTTSQLQPVQVPSLTGMIGVGAGYSHAMALKADGTAWTWGGNSSGQLGDGTTTSRSTPMQVPSLNGITVVSTKWNHNLALRSDGTVWAWGDNGYGQLGDGTTTSRSVPVQVGGLNAVTFIGTGSNQSLAITADRAAWAWGGGYNGQLGNGTFNNSSVPVQVSGFGDAVAITGGSTSHTLALKRDGTVWAWGWNGYGQLGDGGTDNAGVPVRTQLANLLDRSPFVSLRAAGDRVILSSPASVSLAAAASSHDAWTNPIARVEFYRGATLVATATQAPYVYTWVNAPVGVYSFTAKAIDGAGQAALSSLVGVRVLDARFGQAAAGSAHSVVIQPDGTVQAWGDNAFGQLGDGTLVGRSAPAAVSGLTGITALASFHRHNLALAFDGSVWAWGANESGQLGDGTTVQRNLPVRLAALSGIVAVATGNTHSLALRRDGTLYVWGGNGNGQLGDGTTTNRPTPVLATSAGGRVLAVAAGDSHTLVLRDDGTVWAWGNNGNGQLGDGTTVSRAVPAPVPGLSGMSDVAAGSSYSLALKGDGTAWAWGSNLNGRLGDGTTVERHSPVQVSGLSGVAKLFAGGGQSFAARGDGSVSGWGLNGDGQLGDGTTVDRLAPVPLPALNGVTTLAAGLFHSLALKADGSGLAWGRNSSGQLGDGTTAQHLTPTAVVNLGPGVDNDGVAPTITLLEPVGAVLLP